MKYLPLTALLALVWISPALYAQPGGAGRDCNRTSTGLVPLTDLGTGTYQGFEGGLYPGGLNTPPMAHLSAGIGIALNQIMPLDAAGNPDPNNGKVVLVSIGLSHARMESDFLTTLLQSQAGLNPRFQFVNCAEGGKTAEEWSDPNDDVWTLMQTKLAAAGVTGAQVQVAWIKHSIPHWMLTQQSFPQDAQELLGFERSANLMLKIKYPGVKIAYLSARSYGGYAMGQSNSEPFAYENGFITKWLIEQQLNGDPNVAYTGANPPMPWLAWGPYFWADGLGADNVLGGIPGRSDGLEYECDDYASTDGMHPSDPQGRTKISQMILDFLLSESTAAPWFLASGGEPDIDLIAPGGMPVQSGTSHDQGTLTPTSATTVTWTVFNAGSLDLNMTGATPVIIGAQNNCAVTVLNQPTLTIPAGGSATLQLQINPLAAGDFNFQLTIASDDADETIYLVSVQGIFATGSGSGGGGDSDEGSGCAARSDGIFWLGALVICAMLGFWFNRQRRLANTG